MSTVKEIVHAARVATSNAVRAWETACDLAEYEAIRLRRSSQELAQSAAVVAEQANDAEKVSGGIRKLANRASKVLTILTKEADSGGN